MAAVEGSYGNLLQGMSQQPPQQRRDGQCGLQVNMTADPVTNLSKRPAFKYVDELVKTGSPSNTKFHNYERGDKENYLIGVGTDGTVSVAGSDGTVFPVVNQGKNYLASTSPRKEISFTTVGDISIVSNSTKTIKYTDDVVTQPARIANDVINGNHNSIEIRGGAWATNYELTLRHIPTNTLKKISHQTPTGIEEPEETKDEIVPRYIATKILTELGSQFDVTVQEITYPLDFGFVTQNDIIVNQDTPNGKVHFGMSNDSSIIYVSKDYEIVSSNDGNQGTYMRVATDEVEELDDLPASDIIGRIIKVDTSKEMDGAEYYVRFEADANFGEGKWVECLGEGLQYKLDANTMPHAVVRLQETDGSIYFLVTPIDGSSHTNFTGTYELPFWADRGVGDEDSNPTPSFVDSYISFVGLYQNRLYVLSGEAIIMSTSDSYWNFFYHTALQVQDDDPLDFTAGTNNVNTLRQASVHEGDLLLFSDTTQFLVYGNKVLTPENAVMVAISYFNSNVDIKPVPSGRSLIFPIVAGEHSGVRELQTDALSATRDAPPITANVSRLIKGNITSMASSNQSGVMAFTADDLRNRIYIYEYLWQGNELVQAAWSYWEVPENFSAIYVYTIKNVLYCVLEQTATGELFLVKSNLEGFLETSFGFNIHLDMLVELEVDENNSVTVPYDYTEIVFVQADGCPNPGMLAGTYTTTVMTNAPITYTFSKDFIGGKVYAGIKYNSMYEPTRPFVKDSKGVPITTGALTISRYIATYRDSGYIQASLSSGYEDTIIGLLSGRVLGATSNKVGISPIITGSLSIPVLRSPDLSSVVLASDDYKPMRLVNLEWQGQFSKNKRRL